MDDGKKKQLNVWIEQRRLEKLDALAKATGRTRPGVIRLLIDQAEATGRRDVDFVDVREVQPC